MHRVLVTPSLRSTFARSTLAKAACIASCALAFGHASAQITQGPLMQAVADTQAGVWVRTKTSQPVRVKMIAPDGTTTYTPLKTTEDKSDFTAKFVVTGLQPATRYKYQVGTTDPRGEETWSGNYTFDTVAVEPTQLNIAVLSDFADKLEPSPALRTALQAHPDLVATIGDLDHRGPAYGKGGVERPESQAPAVLKDLRNMHRASRDADSALGADFFSGIVGAPDTGVPQVPMLYAWDDHDMCGNNLGDDCRFLAQAFQAWDEYYIAAPDNAASNDCKDPADFQSLTYGHLAQLFFLDARSNRNDDNPKGKVAMLGPCQHHWLVDELHSSSAVWKIVMTPVPINSTVKTWDSWSHFPVEREALLQSIADVPNVVFVSGDIHSGGAIDDGSHSGRPEVATPHANMPTWWVNTYCMYQHTDKLESRPGAWTIGGNFDPVLDVSPLQCGSKVYPEGTPTNGLPADVYPLDGRNNPGYTWISATPTTLQITVRDVNGQVKQGVKAGNVPADLSLTFTNAAR